MPLKAVHDGSPEKLQSSSAAELTPRAAKTRARTLDMPAARSSATLSGTLRRYMFMQCF
jgi:hypothetical protein